MAMRTRDDDFLQQCYLLSRESLKSSRKLFSYLICASAPKRNYHCLTISMEGANGAVIKFQDDETRVITTAVKKCSTPAEIDIFKSLRRRRHPSIVPFNVKKAYGAVFVVAADYVVADLRSYVAAAGSKYSNEIKKWMKQLVEGVDFLHGKGIMHRDLNPNNIFITRGGDLKILNFGKATRFGKEAKKYPYPPYDEDEDEDEDEARTLWYRAPELLKGVEPHSSEVDMWSVGCIMAELVLNRVMFRGKDEEDQVDVIFRVVTFESLGEEAHWNAKHLLSEDGYDLLCGLLTINPRKRITAKAALHHAWFQDG